VRIRPRSLKQSWSWYVALQLLLNKFLLTRFGLGDWKGLFGPISRANGALMATASRHCGRPLAKLGHRMATAGQRQAPVVAGWRAIKMKPCCSFHTRARTLSLSTALSLARIAGAPSALTVAPLPPPASSQLRHLPLYLLDAVAGPGKPR